MAFTREVVDPFTKDAAHLFTEARYAFADRASYAKRLPASSTNSLFAFRFVSLFAHAFVTSCLLQTEPLHVRAGMRSDSTVQGFLKRQQYLHVLILGSMFCLAVDAGLLAFGVSLGKPQVVLVLGCFHSLGAFFTAWCVMDAWGWHSIIAIFALFTFPPFAIEVLLMRPVGPIIRAFSACCSTIWRGGELLAEKLVPRARGFAERFGEGSRARARARYARTPDDTVGA
jgi:hypothetical protein